MTQTTNQRIDLIIEFLKRKNELVHPKLIADIIMKVIDLPDVFMGINPIDDEDLPEFIEKDALELIDLETMFEKNKYSYN